jgi:hypothetical protein
MSGPGYPENLPQHLNWVAEIEAAKQRTPTSTSQALPMNARDFLHLAAIRAWQAIANGQPAPQLDLLDLRLEIYEAFETSGGHNPVDQIYDTWLELARQHGIPVAGDLGDLLPDLDDAITGTITAAVWFGITTGYFTLTRRYHIPRKLLPCYPD